MEVRIKPRNAPGSIAKFYYHADDQCTYLLIAEIEAALRRGWPARPLAFRATANNFRDDADSITFAGPGRVFEIPDIEASLENLQVCGIAIPQMLADCRSLRAWYLPVVGGSTSHR